MKELHVKNKQVLSQSKSHSALSSEDKLDLVH